LATDPKLPGMETFDRVVNLGSSALSSAFDTGMEIPRIQVITDGALTALAAVGTQRKALNCPSLP